MKSKFKLSMLMFVFVTAHANSADVASSVMPSGTLNISGKILDKGCTFQTKDMLIQLPPVEASKFTAAGDLGPKSDLVDFNLTGCPANSTLTFTVAGTEGITTSSFAVTSTSSSALGFDILLYGPDSSVAIKPNDAKTLTTDNSGNYIGSLSAQITANSASVIAGKVDTTLTYTLAYN